MPPGADGGDAGGAGGKGGEGSEGGSGGNEGECVVWRCTLYRPQPLSYTTPTVVGSLQTRNVL
jgi:hypothetical protein